MGCFKLLLDCLARMGLLLYQLASPQEALSIHSEFSCFRLAVLSTEMRLVLGSPGVVPWAHCWGILPPTQRRHGVGSTQLQAPIRVMFLFAVSPFGRVTSPVYETTLPDSVSSWCIKNQNRSISSTFSCSIVDPAL